MPPVPQRKELMDYQKGGIEALSHHENPTEIGKELHIPRRTVSSFLQRSEERGFMEIFSRPGRPRDPLPQLTDG